MNLKEHYKKKLYESFGENLRALGRGIKNAVNTPGLAQSIVKASGGQGVAGAIKNNSKIVRPNFETRTPQQQQHDRGMAAGEAKHADLDADTRAAYLANRYGRRPRG